MNSVYVLIDTDKNTRFLPLAFICYTGIKQILIKRSTFTLQHLAENPNIPSLNCSTSTKDSFWLDFKDGHYKVGLADDPIPKVSYQDKESFTVTTVGILHARHNANLYFDIPCLE